MEQVLNVLDLILTVLREGNLTPQELLLKCKERQPIYTGDFIECLKRLESAGLVYRVLIQGDGPDYMVLSAGKVRPKKMKEDNDK